MAIVCHDAGAANLIFAWLRNNPRPVRACMRGPAAGLWSRQPAAGSILDLEKALDGAAILLSGTSWGDDIEHRARKRARSLGIRSIAVLDHWVNYPERFIREGEEVLPDELWVADDDAREEAGRCFPRLPIRQMPNLYLQGVVQEVATYHPGPVLEPPKHILYVLEPVRQNWGRGDVAGEFQALEFFLGHLRDIGLAADAKIRLRPHPSDPAGKYDDWPRRYPQVDLTIDTGGPLAKLIAWADWVVGCETFALVIALHASRTAISTLPPWAPRCRLPQRELRHLRDLIPAPT